MPIVFPYDQERKANRKVLTGFKSYDDVLECKKSVKGYICHFKETDGKLIFLGLLDPEELEGLDLKNVGACVIPYVHYGLSRNREVVFYKDTIFFSLLYRES